MKLSIYRLTSFFGWCRRNAYVNDLLLLPALAILYTEIWNPYLLVCVKLGLTIKFLRFKRSGLAKNAGREFSLFLNKRITHG